MKVKLEIDFEFDSWFIDNEPNSLEDWSYFFAKHLLGEVFIIGSSDEEAISISSIKVECLKFEK